LKIAKRFEKAAYGKTRNIYGGGILDAGSNIGTKIIQLMYLRPGIWGYRKVRK
jgi:hypothetical protein